MWRLGLRDARHRARARWAYHYARDRLRCCQTLWLRRRPDSTRSSSGTSARRCSTRTSTARMMDGRLAMARLCALTARHERSTRLVREGTRRPRRAGRPPRARHRRLRRGAHVRASRGPRRPRVRAATPRCRVAQFRALGMPGWIDAPRRCRRAAPSRSAAAAAEATPAVRTRTRTRPAPRCAAKATTGPSSTPVSPAA